MNHMVHSFWTDARWKIAQSMKNNGATYLEISDEFNVSIGSISGKFSRMKAMALKMHPHIRSTDLMALVEIDALIKIEDTYPEGIWTKIAEKIFPKHSTINSDWEPLISDDLYAFTRQAAFQNLITMVTKRSENTERSIHELMVRPK